MSEAGSGSDVMSMKLTATKDGEAPVQYRLQYFYSNSTFVVVPCKTLFIPTKYSVVIHCILL